MPAWTLALVLLLALTTGGIAVAWAAALERAAASRVPVRAFSRRPARSGGGHAGHRARH